MTAASISGFHLTRTPAACGAWFAARWLAAALVFAFSPGAAFAQDAIDPPGRVARFTHTEGAVSYAEAGGNNWTNAQLTRPVTSGDRLWVDRGSRSEVHAGSTALRLGALTHLEITALNDQSTELNLTQGSLSMRVRDLQPGEHFQIGTPNVAVLITRPGEYRIDVDQQRDTTRVAVYAGAAVAYGENRESESFAAQQQLTFTDRNLNQVGSNAWLQRDSFDQWAEARDRREDQSVAARYVSREVVGYQQLDQHGEWREEPGYGPVWFPRVVVADWAPYRYGQWRWISPWGWTWIDDAPWGFAPFHYGRWAQVGPQWAWVPGPRTYRPFYAPALVAFVGGNSGGANWNISLNSGGPGVAWFPLGPGDAFRPGYSASRRYYENVNRNIVVNNNTTIVYVNQHRPGAVTAVSMADFGHGRPGRNFQRVADADLARAHIALPPPAPSRTAGFAPQERPAPARALPPPAVLNQPAPPAAANANVPSRYGGFGFNGPDGRRSAREERRDDRRDQRPDRPPQAAVAPQAPIAVQPVIPAQPAIAAQAVMAPQAPPAIAPTRDPRVWQQHEQLQRDQRARQEAAQRQQAQDQQARDQQVRNQRQAQEQRHAQEQQERAQQHQQRQQQMHLHQQQRAQLQAQRAAAIPVATPAAAQAPAKPGPKARPEGQTPGGGERPPGRMLSP